MSKRAHPNYDENNEEENKEEEIKLKDNNDQDEFEFLKPLTNQNKLRNFVDRYFIKYFKVYNEDNDIHQYAFLHTNKLIMVGITKFHAICKKKLNIIKIDFSCVYTGDLNDMVKGKKKRGGVKVKTGTKICEVTCDNNQMFEINGVVDGSLIEFNENLSNNKNWLRDFSESKGYLAIINIGIKGAEKKVENLMKEELYYQKYNKNFN